ncbi:PIN domain-containing protein [Corynebacterium lizhenjunii]|uniref:PIN domain-containing protein n=1 Tax=Corynebacterium lizhenjunii TaxID=2709394 RepID=A0A7T0PAI8_9CORY|nr:PIN domain-containing protein [Corynebacterium lizhenjunii]
MPSGTGGKLPLIVLDTNVWVWYLTDVDPAVTRCIGTLIRGHGCDHLIVVPLVVLVETVGVVRGRASRPAEQRQRSEEALRFFRSQPLIFVDLNQRTAFRAAELCGEHLLKGADAAILASAELMGAQVLYTYDKGLIKVGRALKGLDVRRPTELELIE